MTENNDTMSLKDMGFTASGKLSEGQGLIGVRQLAKSIEKGDLGRLDESEYRGGAGFVDNMLRMTKALIGRDTVSQEVREFIGWIRKDGAEDYKARTEAFLELNGQEQIERMAGGDENIKGALETLFATHQRGQSGDLANFKDLLGDVWQKVEEWRQGQYETDREMIDEYMKGAETAKTETFHSLWEMWDLQEKKDLANRTGNYIRSSDHNRVISPAGEHGSRRKALEGGKIRRAWALVKGLPRELGERGNALARVEGVSEARNLAIQGGLSELKHDALNRTQDGSLERAEMYVRGVITRDELGTEPRHWSRTLDDLTTREEERVSSGGKKNTRYLRRIAKMRAGGEVRGANNGGKIAYYETLYTNMEASAHATYDSKKAEWSKYALKPEGGFAAGLMPAPLTEAAMKLSALGIDGTLKIVKGVDGTIGLAIESMDGVMADWSLGRIAEACVGRELAGETHQNSRTRETARALRGAEAVWQRSAMLAGRTADTLEFSRTSPAILHVPGALMIEGADLVLGGVSVGEKSGQIMESLTARNERLLSAQALMVQERSNVRGNEYQDARDMVDQEINEIFADLPEQFENWEAMNEWKNKKALAFAKFGGLAIRQRMLDAIGKITDPDQMQSEWGKILNAGSARRTKLEVLGLESHDGRRINRTVRQVPLLDQMTIAKKRMAEGDEGLASQEIGTSTGYDSVLEHATLTELTQAQKRWLEIQKKRMDRRSKLDSMWESLPKAAGATAGAFAGMFAFQFLGNHFHEVVAKLGIDLGDANEQLRYAQEALKAAGDPANFISPEFAPTHQSWAEAAGQGQVGAIQNQAVELGKQILKGKVSEVISHGMSIFSGLITLASTGFAGMRLMGGAATPFIGGGVARMTGFVEEQPKIQ